jgi:hypothetical protein
MTIQEKRVKQAADPWATGIVGRCFHIWGQTERGSPTIQYQGVVRALVDQDKALIQFFDWIVGEPSTLSIVSLATMVRDPPDSRKAGSWQFYENVEHMSFWYDHRYRAPKDEDEEIDAAMEAAP